VHVIFPPEITKEAMMRASQSFVGRTAAMCLLVMLSASALALLTRPIHAATEQLYVPQTGHYMKGVFRDFWDKNGGLPNFGYPLTEEYIDPASKHVFQYFERARFERAGADGTQVELANLGLVAAAGRQFPRQKPIQNTAQRRFFPQTSQILQYGFKTVWEGRGGQAIFGLPISSELSEKLTDGTTHTVQYFEKVRFEYHPNLPDGQRVVISSLGRAYAPPALVAPVPGPGTPQSTNAPAKTATPAPTTPAPTSTPAPHIGTPPSSMSGSVAPAAGLTGQTFTFTAQGFQSKERVSLWLTAPDGSAVAFDTQPQANGSGAIAPFTFVVAAGKSLGTWAITAQGVASTHKAVAYFTVLATQTGSLPPPPAPQPAPQTTIPPNVNASATPKSGPVGTLFFFNAGGFRAGEDVKLTVVGSDGRQIAFAAPVKADANGSIGYAKPYYLARPGDSLGLYSLIAIGTNSNTTSTAYFVLTP
jgi:hypothetical protein